MILLKSRVLNLLVHCAETDVIRVFDRTMHLSEDKIFEYLKQADLENYGFVKTTEVSTETDENGKKTTKKTIYYKVTDDCSKVKFWESVLTKRLPKKFANPKIFSDTIKEVESRIIGRNTKSCTVILEVHPNSCLEDEKNASKRGLRRPCGICWSCSSVKITYGN